MWDNSEFLSKKQILQKGKEKEDKFEEKLMFTVSFNLIQSVESQGLGACEKKHYTIHMYSIFFVSDASNPCVLGH